MRYFFIISYIFGTINYMFGHSITYLRFSKHNLSASLCFYSNLGIW